MAPLVAGACACALSCLVPKDVGSPKPHILQEEETELMANEAGPKQDVRD